MSEHPEHPDSDHIRGVRIRRYRRDDFAAFERLELTGHLDANSARAHSEPVIPVSGQEVLWVAELDRRVIGTVGVERVVADIAHLHHLRVESGWRGHGVAKELVATAARYARDLSCLKLLLESEILTERAIQVLHRLGFQYVGDRHDGNQRLLQFYLDLYSRPDDKDQSLSDDRPGR